MRQPLVSIGCLAYNHELYIEKTLQGFLNQKADFEFEIIIHEDASTDKTRSIIEAYAEKYPDIIKPIYRTENQYSKGKKMFEILFSYAQGKYIALCEGDDYWTDDFKLQKQVAFMERNFEYSLCYHNVKINIENEIFDDDIRRYSGNQRVPLEDMIRGEGLFCPTASLLFRKSLVEKLPEFYYKADVEDYPLQLYLATKGKVFYFCECMAVYRKGHDGSWTNKERWNPQRIIDHGKIEIKWLKMFDVYTDFNYHRVLYEDISSYEKKMINVSRSQAEKLLHEKNFWKALKETEFKYKMIRLLEWKCISLYNILRYIKSKVYNKRTKG